MRAKLAIPLAALLSYIFAAPVLYAQETKAASARLEIATTKQTLSREQPVKLTITLRNVSKEVFYVTANVNVGVLNAFGNFEVEFRRLGSQRFRPFPQAVFHSISDEGYSSAEEFIARQNLILLNPGQFIGADLEDAAKIDPKLMPPGTYEIRVVFTAPPVSKVPSLNRPLFTGTVVSNQIQIQVTR